MGIIGKKPYDFMPYSLAQGTLTNPAKYFKASSFTIFPLISPLTAYLDSTSAQSVTYDSSCTFSQNNDLRTEC